MRTTTDPTGRSPRGLRSAAAVFATAALVAGGLLAATPATAAPAPVTGQNSELPSGLGGTTHLEAGRYIVTLKGDPAASYTGGVNGYAATAPKQGRQLLAGLEPLERFGRRPDEGGFAVGIFGVCRCGDCGFDWFGSCVCCSCGYGGFCGFWCCFRFRLVCWCYDLFIGHELQPESLW